MKSMGKVGKKVVFNDKVYEVLEDTKDGCLIIGNGNLLEYEVDEENVDFL